jgi:hypothetical protein
MKTKMKLHTIISVLSLSILLSSCTEEMMNPKNPTNETEKTETERVVLLKTKLDNAAFNLVGTKFKAQVDGRSQTGVHRFSGLFKSKEEAGRIAEGWDTCALVTITENSDGTYTIILNFGEGCEDNGKFITGVVAFTGSETDTSGVFKIAFDKFSERGVNELVDDPSTINGFYDASWSISLHNGISYEEQFTAAFEVNYESGAKETIAGEGELNGDLDGFVVTKYNFIGSNLKGDKYAAVVVNPLVFDFSCKSTSIYTQGTEAFEVNEQKSSIDFGEGDCDNIFTIFLEGITIIVDLDKINA